MHLNRPIIFSLLILFCFAPLYAESVYPFDNPKQAAQFKHLIDDLRCPVCQNQNLADSNAKLAQNLREEVYQFVRAGQSDDEILHYMRARYGDFIVFNPPVKSITMLLWYGPVIFLIGGIVIFYYKLKKSHD